MIRQDLEDLIFEVYGTFLTTHQTKFLLESDEKKTVFREADSDILPDSTEQILAKYPQLKHCLERLQTDDFMEFVSDIDWISPRPTVFRINLKNGTNFNLKWMGKDFEATISGKKYYLGQLTDYQKALSRLTDLYQEGPLGEEPENEQPGTPGESQSGFSSSGGNFPGGEPVAATKGEIPTKGGEIPASEEGEESVASGEAGQKSKDLHDEPIDFETDASI